MQRRVLHHFKSRVGIRYLHVGALLCALIGMPTSADEGEVEREFASIVNLQDEREALQALEGFVQRFPDYDEGWIRLAWFRAYRIAPAQPGREQRWALIAESIADLRDKAIPHRATDKLYRELTWHFIHRIPGEFDPNHGYYKYMFAKEWERIVGPTRDGTAEQTVRVFEPIATMYTKYIKARRSASLDQLIGELADQEPSVRKEVDSLSRESRTPDRSLLDLADASPPTPPRAKLLALIRAHTIVHDYHMDPAEMLELMEGAWTSSAEPRVPLPVPLDWRSPGAHGLYWAYRQLKLAIGQNNGQPPSVLQAVGDNTVSPQIHHSLDLLLHHGHIELDGARQYAHCTTDTRYVGILNSFHLARLRNVTHNPKADAKDREFVEHNYGYFLQEVVDLYEGTGDQKSAWFYRQLMTRVRGKDSSPRASPSANIP